MRLNTKQKTAIGKILALTPRLTKTAVRLLKESDSATGRGMGLLYEKRAAPLVKDYQRFLIIRVMHPDEPLCPLNAMDAMWHAHILDTRAYQADCFEIFGEFLHHDPNAVDVHLLATKTWELYLKTFSSGAWGKPAAVLKPLALTEDEAGLAKVHSVDCYTGHCGGA